MPWVKNCSVHINKNVITKWNTYYKMSMLCCGKRWLFCYFTRHRKHWVNHCGVDSLTKYINFAEFTHIWEGRFEWPNLEDRLRLNYKTIVRLFQAFKWQFCFVIRAVWMEKSKSYCTYAEYNDSGAGVSTGLCMCCQRDKNI